MLLDPELFPVDKAKEMGLWPPGDAVAHGVFPYIKRLKVDKVKILDVGCMKGENAVYMLELDVDNKIERIDLEVSGGSKEFADVLSTNISGNDRLSTFNSGQTDEYDVVCIHANCKNLPKTMRKFYHRLKPNGIFCGNDHGATRVKDALLEFRREDRIGTPINVSNGCWFWYKR